MMYSGEKSRRRDSGSKMSGYIQRHKRKLVGKIELRGKGHIETKKGT